MAVYAIEPEGRARAKVSFDALWDHYVETGYLYAEKAERLHPYLARIRHGWPRLMRAPSDLFQLNVGLRGGRISATHALFRDTPRTMTMQHASSLGDPAAMLACIRAGVRGHAETGCVFLATSFRPENRWTSRLVRVLNQAHPAEHGDTLTRAFLVARPDRGGGASLPKGIRRLGACDADAAVRLATRALGELRASALDLEAGGGPRLPTLSTRYEAVGLRRERRIWGAYRDGELAGLAIRYAGSPVNSGLLCQRAELIAAPELDARAAAAVVRDLAVALRQRATADDVQIPLLVLEEHASAATAAGFAQSGRCYSHALWDMRCGPEHGLAGLDAFYERVRRSADRLKRRPARVT